MARVAPDVAAIHLGHALLHASRNLPGWLGRKCPRLPAHHPYSVLLPVGFAMPPLLPAARCALTAPFHPYPAASRVAVQRHDRWLGGILSAALSLGSPPPDVIRHRLSMEPGLSSQGTFRHSPARPPGRLTRPIKGFAAPNATKNPAHQCRVIATRLRCTATRDAVYRYPLTLEQ